MPDVWTTRLDLKTVVADLAAQDPPGAPLTDPFEIIVWENIGYLIDDGARETLFRELEARIGLSAAAIAGAPDEVLRGITRRGGMHPDKRAERLLDIARIVLADCSGDLAGTLATLPLAKARALLKRFPSIADPGADRILLFGGFAAVPSVDSNGLRAMVRMGFAMERPGNYGATYREAVAALAGQGEMTRPWLMQAYLVLREHGKTLCRRSQPQCLACPLDAGCAHAVISQL